MKSQRTWREHSSSTMASQKKRSMPITKRSLIQRKNVWASSRSTRVIHKFATGAARATNNQRSFGNGPQLRRHGTNTMMAPGITGVHPRLVSQKVDGNGTMATGTMMALPTSTTTAPGSASKNTTGLHTARKSQSTQSHQLAAERSAGHSTRWWRLDSLWVFLPRMSLDARLESSFTCGPMTPPANSLVESSPTRSAQSVRKERITSGREWSNVLRATKFLPKVALTTEPVNLDPQCTNSNNAKCTEIKSHALFTFIFTANATGFQTLRPTGTWWRVAQNK